MATQNALYLGPRLRRLRRDLGLTQAQMAGDLDISASYIALLERNQRPLTADLSVEEGGAISGTIPVTQSEYFLIENRRQDLDGDGAFDFDDVNGDSSFDFYTDRKVTISRWF